jgi:polyisoprenoid-binding protein YceI
MRPGPIVFACVLAITGVAGAGQAGNDFKIDPASSNLVVRVGRAGLLAFAGHDHEVAVPVIEGRVTLDRTNVNRSSVSAQFDAAAMTVTGRGEPPADVPEVQRVMRSDRVLDVARYPRIAFSSRRISLVEASPDRMTLRVEGQLTLRGITQPVTVPVEVRLSGDRLTATGKAIVQQTLFGIRPVTAGAGTVRVKDDVEVVFNIVARS